MRKRMTLHRRELGGVSRQRSEMSRSHGGQRRDVDVMVSSAGGSAFDSVSPMPAALVFLFFPFFFRKPLGSGATWDCRNGRVGDVAGAICFVGGDGGGVGGRSCCVWYCIVNAYHDTDHHAGLIGMRYLSSFMEMRPACILYQLYNCLMTAKSSDPAVMSSSLRELRPFPSRPFLWTLLGPA